MKKLFFLVVLMAMIFTACQKESNSPQQIALTGSWNFTSLNAQTQSISEYDFFGTAEKAISISNYTTTNNAGTVTFDGSVMNTVGLAYTVSSSVKTYTYENDVLIDSAELPFIYTLPSTNSTAQYQLIGSDSIYFPNGSFIATAGTGTQSEPSGGRINMNGNLLTLSQWINKDTAEVIGGISYHVVETAKAVISLTKQ